MNDGNFVQVIFKSSVPRLLNHWNLWLFPELLICLGTPWNDFFEPIKIVSMGITPVSYLNLKKEQFMVIYYIIYLHSKMKDWEMKIDWLIFIGRVIDLQSDINQYWPIRMEYSVYWSANLTRSYYYGIVAYLDRGINLYRSTTPIVLEEVHDPEISPILYDSGHTRYTVFDWYLFGLGKNITDTVIYINQSEWLYHASGCQV